MFDQHKRITDITLPVTGIKILNSTIFLPSSQSYFSIELSLTLYRPNPPNRYKHLSIAHDAWCLLGLCRSVNCLHCSLNVSKQYTPRFQVFLPNTGSPPDTIISLPDKKFNVKSVICNRRGVYHNLLSFKTEMKY